MYKPAYLVLLGVHFAYISGPLATLRGSMDWVLEVAGPVIQPCVTDPYDLSST